MSKIQVQGNVSGTGVITLAAPNTNSNITLTIPAVSAELITNSSGVLNIGSGQVYKDASGNVGIGTSSPGYKFDVNGQARLGGATGLLFGVGTAFAGGQAEVYTISTTPMGLGTTGSASLQFYTGSSERARIDTSGRLLVGTTSVLVKDSKLGSYSTVANQFSAFFDHQATVNAYGLGIRSRTGENIYFYNGTGEAPIGSVTTTGSTTAYNTSSDYRLKENVAPMTGALDKVAALKPVTYTWKTDGSAGQGFIAHELQEVVPDCVTGTKDAVDKDGKPQYQGVDTSFLVATLVSALQEQQTLIADLTTRLEALENN
jgi:hypothetical protein